MGRYHKSREFIISNLQMEKVTVELLLNANDGARVLSYFVLLPGSLVVFSDPLRQTPPKRRCWEAAHSGMASSLARRANFVSILDYLICWKCPHFLFTKMW